MEEEEEDYYMDTIIDNAYKEAWRMIQDEGFEQWFHGHLTNNVNTDLNESCVHAMIRYYEGNEQYERCDWLLQNLNKCKDANVKPLEDRMEDFYSDLGCALD